MSSLTIFIDNGVTGTIGAVGSDTAPYFGIMPTIKTQDYTKAKKNISRVDTTSLSDTLCRLIDGKYELYEVMAYLERPMINPTRFTASISAARALEATITVLETMRIPYQFVDSKDWQRKLLPSSGKKGTTSDVLKHESMDIGLRLFPQFSDLIRKHKDADGILGAYALSKQ